MIPSACSMNHTCVVMRLYRVFNMLTMSVVVICVNVPNMPTTTHDKRGHATRMRVSVLGAGINGDSHLISSSLLLNFAFSGAANRERAEPAAGRRFAAETPALPSPRSRPPSCRPRGPNRPGGR